MKKLLLAMIPLAAFGLWGTVFPPKPVELDSFGLLHTRSDQDPPSSDGTAVFSREGEDLLIARKRVTFDCSTHVFNAAGWFEPSKKGGTLCYQLLKNSPTEDRLIYGACPQDLVIRFALRNVPRDGSPTFEFSDNCAPPAP